MTFPSPVQANSFTAIVPRAPLDRKCRCLLALCSFEKAVGETIFLRRLFVLLFYKKDYKRVSHFPQNTVSLAVAVNSPLPQIFSIAVRMLVRVVP